MSFKILFMGTPLFAVPVLECLNNSKHKILEVYTQPPKKKNRGQKISFSPVHEYSSKINIPIRNPVTLESDAEYEHIKKINPDIVVVVAYGKILPKKILDLKNTMFINSIPINYPISCCINFVSEHNYVRKYRLFCGYMFV